jgi:hypothetical protein
MDWKEFERTVRDAVSLIPGHERYKARHVNLAPPSIEIADTIRDCVVGYVESGGRASAGHHNRVNLHVQINRHTASESEVYAACARRLIDHYIEQCALVLAPSPPVLVIDGIAFAWDAECESFALGDVRLRQRQNVSGASYWSASVKCAAIGAGSGATANPKPAPDRALAELRAEISGRVKGHREMAAGQTRIADHLESALRAINPR